MSKPRPNLRETFAVQAVPEPQVQAIPVAVQLDELAAMPRPKSSRSHGDKKPVLIHIPPDMHKVLKRVALDDETTLAAITEKQLRAFLVTKGYTKFA
jgi:hypothetical protein